MGPKTVYKWHNDSVSHLAGILKPLRGLHVVLLRAMMALCISLVSVTSTKCELSLKEKIFFV